ncbi:MAG: DUF3160 domain-containing protein [Prevotella sp.]|nr:DUF3160 domain-containing protein [Prevotella sp.]
MKKLFFLLFALIGVMSTSAQEPAPMILPGAGHINVEKLDKGLNLNMDISKLSLSELRVLRNAIPARKGYVFTSSDLRKIFESTSWYYERALKVFEGSKKVTYTAAEQKFMDRVKAREEELKKKNYAGGAGNIVNTDNIINPYQLTEMNPKLKNALAKNGFGIIRTDQEQLFQIYERNSYQVFPSFVTTDLYLQLFHIYFDCMLRRVEEGMLSEKITTLCEQLYEQSKQQSVLSSDSRIAEAAEWNMTYFAIARALIKGEPLTGVPAKYTAMAAEEINNINEATDGYSDFLEYKRVKFAYSLFRPRGHYTRTDGLKRYFKTMMWLQDVPFGTDIDHQLIRAALIAETVTGNADVRKTYDEVFTPITFLIGEPDNVTITQMSDILRHFSTSALGMLQNKDKMESVRKAADSIGERQTRIRPKYERTSHVKINFMPQRYTPDAEVLLETVDYDNEPTLRDVPSGLDVMAALGSTTAENILIKELGTDKQWPGFVAALTAMKGKMKLVKWDASVYNSWEDALALLNNANDSRWPYFMKTDAWGKKTLNASLASWAELKHDAILYAKQPFGAECGGGDALPDPVTKGYVEPNVAFWEKAIQLVDAMDNVMDRYQLHANNTKELTESVKEKAQFLLDISKKELAGKALTDNEYQTIRHIGDDYEWLSLALLSQPDEELYGWYQVQDADKKVALVADVYTANADNNPEKSILFEAVGPADEIYVLVEVDGLLYLMRGAVFSYREFKRPIGDPRMTDEEWQQHLETYPDEGLPSWMKEIIVPIEKPKANDAVFFSSDC